MNISPHRLRKGSGTMKPRLQSPMPTPVFGNEGIFSHKSARTRSRLDDFHQPPRPPVKSAPPVSRIFRHTRRYSDGPQRVSFGSKQDVLDNLCYNSMSHVPYFEQCFKIIGKLGQGSFGEVFKVESKEDGCLYAVKKSRVRFRGEYDRQQRLDEVKKHEKLRQHPNCVKLIKAWEERGQLYIQTELCDMSLTDFCDKHTKIEERFVWDILVDLTQGLKHLHDNNMVHMDIKPSNVLIGLDSLYKIADFGLVLDLYNHHFSEGQEGDPMYLAPELLEGQFSKAADIFSLGISLLEVACDLDLPRGGDAWHHLREKRIPMSFLQGVSAELSCLICRMMDPLPGNRPTVDDILKEPVVIKANARRKRLKLLNAASAKFKIILSPFTFLLFWIWYTFVVKPFHILCDCNNFRVSSTTELLQENMFDYSHYSEDSVFGMTSFSTSIDEKLSLKNSFSPRNISRSYLLSDEDSPRRTSPFHTCLSKHSPWRDASGSITPPIANSSPRMNCTPPSESAKYISGIDPILKSQIGPKNLMEIFEDVAKDSESF
ncbi:membrane-associated tyrosine- and threonine-specific cdc2-inhibitory kinase-like [Xenia sp. Carnegie-2017]|uniref:membrane-associated tyrosine- and threonine-specific cdc2-inhibitory kinase-like n=1 Tax=Xenia sp. Carnegie-2017 TaxID=2897299 RepID=UPI001F03E68C|nr:membrane-associated tyrosine- and threonine-specific cdc2-inhibitory kinase-like [Xenia sp. Carnegie-2017]